MLRRPLDELGGGNFSRRRPLEVDSSHPDPELDGPSRSLKVLGCGRRFAAGTRGGLLIGYVKSFVDLS